MHEFKKHLKKHRKWGIVFILLIASFLRFYNLNKWLVWGMDQEYEAYIVKNIVSLRHFPLIGVNVSDTGVYLGPFFIYFATLPFMIFQGNPVGWAITASLMGIVVCLLIYKIGKAMFSETAGYFGAFLYAVSFLTTFYDRQFWNPSLVPFFSLFIGYLLYTILQGQTHKLLILSLAFGLAIQTHLSILVFLPLIIYVLWLKRHEFSKRVIIFSIIIFILLQSPLILFELRHGFLNSKATINLINRFNTSQLSSSYTERIGLFVSTLGRFGWLPAAPDLFLETGKCLDYYPFSKGAYIESILIVLGGLVFFIWYHLRYLLFSSKYKKHAEYLNQHNSAIVIIGLVLITFFVILVYSSRLYEHYFLYFLPWLAILLGWVVSHFWKSKLGQIILSIILLLFISSNLLTVFTANMSYSYFDKLNIVEFVKKNLGDKSYSLEALGECPRFGGYRYLFSLYDLTPQRSYMDSYFYWLYPDDISEQKPGKTVLLSLIDYRDSPDKIARWQERKLQFITQSEVFAEKRSGNIQAYILE